MQISVMKFLGQEKLCFYTSSFLRDFQKIMRRKSGASVNTTNLFLREMGGGGRKDKLTRCIFGSRQAGRDSTVDAEALK